MLSRELFADALQGVAEGELSPFRDRRQAAAIVDLCLRLFDSQCEVAAEVQRTGGGGFTSAVGDDEVPDIRVYDATEHALARRSGTVPVPLQLTAVTRRVRSRRAS